MAMIEGPAIKLRIQVIWKLEAPTKVTVFMWLMLRNKVLTIDNILRRKGWETVQHLFMHFEYAKLVQRKLQVQLELP